MNLAWRKFRNLTDLPPLTGNRILRGCGKMADKLANGLENLAINENIEASKEQNAEGALENKWLFPLPELYKHALHFYKGKPLFLTFIFLKIIYFDVSKTSGSPIAGLPSFQTGLE